MKWLQCKTLNLVRNSVETAWQKLQKLQNYSAEETDIYEDTEKEHQCSYKVSMFMFILHKLVTGTKFLLQFFSQCFAIMKSL